MTQTSTATHSLHLKHRVTASRDRVFQAFTNPVELAKWWAPEGFSDASGEIDLRVGGIYRWSMRAPDGELYVATGAFTEIEIPEKLVQTWQWEGDEEVTELTLLFHDCGETTEIELLHKGFDDRARADKHEEGWTGCLQRVAGQF
jgi:uncharacterized protein YndB with AHSA1/START domain